MRAKELTITLFSGAFSSEINGAHLRYAYVVLVDPADWLLPPPVGEDDEARLPQYLANESIGSLERVVTSGSATAFSLGRGEPPLILLSPEQLELSLREA